MIMVGFRRQWKISLNARNPYLFISKYKPKYVSAHEITLINASNNIGKKSMSIQHFQTKLGITKYSIVTNSNDSVHTGFMTEHDLAMLL